MSSDVAAITLFRDCDVVLMDFDGPLCRLFRDGVAAQVAETLLDHLASTGVDTRSEGWATTDPLAVLRMSADRVPQLSKAIHEELLKCEVEAAAASVPTPSAYQVLEQIVASGHRTAIVSNNAEQAVRTYLERHHWDGLVSAISARSTFDTPMKPNPYLVTAALQALHTEPNRAVFVGDSISDVVAAAAADVACIGLANKPGKDDNLRRAGCGAVIASMSELLIV